MSQDMRLTPHAGTQPQTDRHPPQAWPARSQTPVIPAHGNAWPHCSQQPALAHNLMQHGSWLKLSGELLKCLIHNVASAALSLNQLLAV